MHSWCADRGRRSVLQNSMAAVATAELAPAAALADGGDVAVLNNGMKFPKAPKHKNGTWSNAHPKKGVSKRGNYYFEALS